MTWRRQDVGLDDRFECCGLMYRVVGLIDEPVVVIVPADERDGDEREHFVIGSNDFAQFNKIVALSPYDDTPA